MYQSREEVIKCPHMMPLLSYLYEKHNLPKYGWQSQGLRYHYTDASGLLGIIQNGRLWATDFRFLNDPSEGTFLPERILALMSEKLGGINEIEQKIIQGLKEALHNPPHANYSSFCVSLSANGDLLSQWRGYGNFGKGYAIGLKLGGGWPHPQIAQYYDVTYGDEGLADLALDLLDLFVSSFEKWKYIMLEEWAYTLNVLARSFKDRNYSEEQETRIVFGYSPEEGNDLFERELPLNFRAKGSDLIPYIPMSLNALESEMDTPRLPIERIIVGPGVDFERNAASIKTLLNMYSYHDVIIEPSKIPFRP